MQSKQGKRSKTAKPKRRVARPEAKIVSKPRRAPKNGIRSREQVSFMSAPVSSTVVRRNFFGFKFGAAAPHDEFPEGGLRISGVLPGTSSSGTLVSDLVTDGLFGVTGAYTVLVSPTGNSSSGVTSVFSSTGPLAIFSQYFRRYRFRHLEAEYNSRIATSSSDNVTIQISYERDPEVAANTTYSATSAVTAQTARFNSWVPEARIPLIDLRSMSKSDELWWCAKAGDASTDTVSLNRQLFQGAIVAVRTQSTSPAADVTLGNLLFRFSVDLYGFTNQPELDITRREKKEGENKKELKRVELSRTSDQRHSVQPEVSGFDFVELTPRSKREKDEKTPPPSVRASSEKGSRRA